MEELTCAYCGKKFKANPSQNRIYCSRECYSRARFSYDRIGRKELRKKYWDEKKSCLEIAEEIGCSDRQVRRLLDKYDLGRRTKSEALKLAENSHPTINPNLEKNTNLAYILGVLSGDGWINKNNYNYRIGLGVTEKAFAKEFKSGLERINLNPNIRIEELSEENENWQDQFQVIANSKVFFDWYKRLSLSDIKINYLSQEKYQIAFLKGLCESEGTIEQRTENSWRLEIYNSDKSLINLIQELLKKLGFDAGLTSTKREKKKREYNLYIRGGTEEVSNFISMINPCIKRGEL